MIDAKHFVTWKTLQKHNDVELSIKRLIMGNENWITQDNSVQIKRELKKTPQFVRGFRLSNEFFLYVW